MCVNNIVAGLQCHAIQCVAGNDVWQCVNSGDLDAVVVTAMVMEVVVIEWGGDWCRVTRGERDDVK